MKKLSASKAEKKERFNKSLRELRHSKFKIDMRVGTLKRSAARIIQGVRDVRSGANIHIAQRHLDQEISLLKDCTEMLCAITTELSCDASLALLDIANEHY
jgi:hypothetical protein